jgi:hypothetical protein
VYLHQHLTGEAGWDHRDGNGLNNRRVNLRPATMAENAMNSASRGASGFKGVYGRRNARTFFSTIAVAENPYLYLGSFKTKEEAARAYDDAARKHHGEFACVNFPRDGERAARVA